MPGIYTRDLNPAPSVTDSSLIAVSEEGINELYKTTVGDIRDLYQDLSRCKAYLSSNYTITTTDSPIPFNSVSFNQGSNWDTVQYRYNVPADGVYMISMFCKFHAGPVEWVPGIHGVRYRVQSNTGVIYEFYADGVWYNDPSSWVNGVWPTRPEIMFHQASAGDWINVVIRKFVSGTITYPVVMSGLTTGATITIMQLV